MKRRILALILVLVMVLGLCACGEKDDGKTPDNNPSPPAGDNNVQPPADGGDSQGGDPSDITAWILEPDTSISGTVRWWMPFKGSAGMDALIAEFNETYPNIKVELTTYNNNTDGNMAVNTAIMAGEVDVLASFGLSNAYPRWENGLYLDLTDKCQEEGIDLVANWGTDADTYETTIFTFPC